MAGYNGYSKSNNAIDAERDYKYPKSTAKRLLGLKDSAFGSPCEWHHTSMWYNRTDYYDLRDLIVRQTLREHSTARPNAEQLLMRARVRRMLAEELAPARSLVKPESESPIMAQMMAAARQYRDAIEAKSRAKSAAAVAERQAHVEAERAAAAADYDAQLRRRCVCNGITKERIAAALAGAELENKTGLYAQIRAWFRGREDRAMEYAVC